jgi:hypothetical protein
MGTGNEKNELNELNTMCSNIIRFFRLIRGVAQATLKGTA